MRKYLFFITILMLNTTAIAQKFITKSGHIKFYSETPMETIEANNRQVNSAYNHDDGAIVFKILMKSFEFEKALMQEHFNENYVESDEFPNALFQGNIINNSDIDLAIFGEVEVKVKGRITIHGITKDIEAMALMDIQKDKINAHAKMTIDPSDFDIKIPGAVIKNIAKEIEVSINVSLNKLSK